MSPRYFSWFLLVVFFAGLVSCQQTKYKGRWRASGDRVYFFSDDKEFGLEITHRCAGLQSTLVVLNSKTEYDNVRRIKVPGKDYWMGLLFDREESLLQWDDGSYPNYLNNHHSFRRREQECRFYMDEKDYGWKYRLLYNEDSRGRVSILIANYTMQQEDYLKKNSGACEGAYNKFYPPVHGWS